MLSRRSFLQYCAATGVGMAAASQEVPLAAKKSNVLFILVDDLGWTDLGGYGSSLYKTPNLDRWAKSAIRFTDAYAASPVCSPTRAAIMTGKHPARLNITDWIPGKNPTDKKLLGTQDVHQLPLGEVTIAEALAAQGYANFFAGKWHLGDAGHFPEDQGFAINKGGHHKGSPPGGYYSPYKNPKLADGPKGEYLPDRLTNECLSFIETHQDEPFFAYLSFYTVHTPIQASKRHLAACEKRAKNLPEEAPRQRQERDGYTCLDQYDPKYASMVEAMDENVGRVLDKLKELKLYEDTLIIFTSDNGGLSTLASEKRVAPTCNEPLRAGKGWAYEGGIRVPLIISGPGVAAPGRTCSSPVISMDFYPTILDMLKLPLAPKQHQDGISLAPLLKGQSDLERSTLYWHYPHYHGSAWRPGAALRSGDWKLIYFYEEEKAELYHLANDPQESHDCAAELPEKTEALMKALRQWQRDIGALLPTPNPAHKND